MNDLINLPFWNEDKLIGNSNVKDVRMALEEIEKDEKLPYDVQFKHDMTRWSTSKQRQKQKNNRIKEKYSESTQKNCTIYKT